MLTKDIRVRLSALPLTLLAAAIAIPAMADAELSFEQHAVIPLPEGFFPTCVAVADLNRNGLHDLVVTGRTLAGEILIIPGLGGGDFAPPVPVLTGFQTDWVEIRDFDGDGHPDLAVLTRTATGMVLLYRGRGDGTFSEPEVTTVGRFPTAMRSEDLNGSGAFDLVVANALSDTMQVLLNDGFGTFLGDPRERVRPMAPGLRRPARPHYFSLADIDDDGHPDIIASHQFGPRVSVLRGKPEGTFALPRVYRVGQPSSATAADLTGNGHKDLVIAELAPFQALITIHEGDGSSSFGPPATFPVGNFPWWLSTADLDGDGSQDIIMTDFSLSSVVVARNAAVDGVAALDPPVVLFMGGFPRMVTTADLTGNCLPDLITADIAQHRLFVHLNRSTEKSMCPSADLNGDGRVDIEDLLILLAHWGTPGPLGDLDLDGWVDSIDLFRLLAAWGPVP